MQEKLSKKVKKGQMTQAQADEAMKHYNEVGQVLETEK